MKKLFATIAAALLVSGVTMAQVDDTQNNPSNNATAPAQADTTQTDMNTEDNGINDKLEGGNENTDAESDEPKSPTEDNGINDRLEGGKDKADEKADEMGDAMRKAGEEVEQEADEAGEGLEKTGNEIKSGAEQTADSLKTGATRAAEDVEQGVEGAGNAVESAADDVNRAVGSGSGSTNANATDDATPGTGMNSVADAEDDAPNFGPEVEVVTDMEGPQNQVVYKVDGDFYYVDREQQQLVKADKSDLKDAAHPAIIHNSSDDSNKSTRSNKR